MENDYFGFNVYTLNLTNDVINNSDDENII